jgi:hypothetical protein
MAIVAKVWHSRECGVYSARVFSFICLLKAMRVNGIKGSIRSPLHCYAVHRDLAVSLSSCTEYAFVSSANKHQPVPVFVRPSRSTLVACGGCSSFGASSYASVPLVVVCIFVSIVFLESSSRTTYAVKAIRHDDFQPKHLGSGL